MEILDRKISRDRHREDNRQDYEDGIEGRCLSTEIGRIGEKAGSCFDRSCDRARRVVSCQLVPSLYEPPLLLANLTLPLFVSFTRPRRRCSPRQRCCIRATSNDNERPPRTHALPPYDTHFVHLSCLPRTAPSIPSACARVPIRATVLCHMRERAFVGTRCRYRNL